MIGARAFGLLGIALLGSAGSALGCSGIEERPSPPTSECPARGCGLPGNVGTRPPPAGGGSAGQGGDGEGGEASEVTLTGTVGLLVDDGFEFAEPFTETVDLRAESTRDASATGVWNGSGQFEIEGVLSASAIWVQGSPRSGAHDALAALQPMRTNNPDADGVVLSRDPFVLVRKSVLEEIFTLASTPVVFNPSVAQVVLRVVGGSAQNGLPGVTVTAPAAEIVLYAINGGFSDIPEETDASGLVVLGNVPGSPWPGRSLAVSFSGARTSSLDLPVMTGTVTLVPVVP